MTSVAAEQKHAATDVIGAQAPSRQPCTAPRAGDQLQRSAQSPVGALLVVDLAAGLVVAVGGDLAADPQAEPERRGAPAPVADSDSLTTQVLTGTDQRRGSLELLGGEQSQRVAHEYRDALRAVAGVSALTDDALQSA